MTPVPDPRDCWREDRRLVRRMLAGHEAAFADFARDCLPVLYRFARRRLGGDEDLASEVVQATVCVAIRKLGQFRGGAALTTWLCACCRNEIAAHYRRAGGARLVSLETARPAPAQVAEPGDGPERALLRKERAELVHRALDELPRQYARVLEWKYLENLSVEAIAVRLERGGKAAESLLTRARQAFRVAYARLEGAPERESFDDLSEEAVTPW